MQKLAVFNKKTSNLGLILLSAFFFSCSPINEKLGLSDDHLAEEVTEFIIEQKTGIDIDLSP